MGYAEAGDAHLQRSALALAFALPDEHVGVAWGAIGWARPAVVAHLRFLEDTAHQRSEFEEDRLAKAAGAIEAEAADRRRRQERRAEVNTAAGGSVPADGDGDDVPLKAASTSLRTTTRFLPSRREPDKGAGAPAPAPRRAARGRYLGGADPRGP